MVDPLALDEAGAGALFEAGFWLLRCITQDSVLGKINIKPILNNKRSNAIRLGIRPLVFVMFYCVLFGN